MFRYLTLLVFVVIAACTTKKEAEATVADEEWPLMDEFHMVMAESFHPFKDSANIAPAIAHAAEMAALAEKWSNAELPSKVNNDEVKTNLQTLKTETAAFAELVQGGDEAAIGAALKDLHDLFHKLQDAWYHGEHGGHGHKH
ncbi:MAG: hypothetical protein KF725_05930 [Cyclobacteriaceae bacterium]|nr:hypothetical protein [Cyclobacteriaceae bacterium]UYN85205.1 MAG: hypothetical protein KIT51_09880 [Cyclobacteriaceae bacterium]